MGIKRIGPDKWLTQIPLRIKWLRDWYCKRKFRCYGYGVEIRPGAYIVGTDNIALGNNITIRPGSHIYASKGGGINIFDNVLLGSGVHIYDNNHIIHTTFIEDKYIYKPIVIYDNAWIGANTVLLAGSVIGPGAVIGAGSVVTGKLVPGYEIWSGNPAKKIGERELDV